jgi:predicted nucleotidyltransferase
METYNKNEMKILDLFRKNLFLKASIHEIMKKIYSKSYQRIYDAITNLIKKNILKSEKIGNLRLISLKLTRESNIALSYLDDFENKNIPNYSKIIEIKEISDNIILVTGSYAKGTATKKSDLDLVVIVPNEMDIVKIQKKIENETMLYVPEMHIYVFRKKDFVEMLVEKKENYGKEIFKNNILLKNSQLYYELIKEAFENGFKG